MLESSDGRLVSWLFSMCSLAAAGFLVHAYAWKVHISQVWIYLCVLLTVHWVSFASDLLHLPLCFGASSICILLLLLLLFEQHQPCALDFRKVSSKLDVSTFLQTLACISSRSFVISNSKLRIWASPASMGFCRICVICFFMCPFLCFYHLSSITFLARISPCNFIFFDDFSLHMCDFATSAPPPRFPNFSFPD